MGQGHAVDWVLMDITGYYTVSNILFLIAAYPMLKEALRNRHVLRGFSRWGAFAALLGMLVLCMAYVDGASWVNVALSMPSIGYYALIVYYSRKS